MMALISIYVDDNEFNRVLDAVASYHQWQGETASGTKQEFLNLIIRGFLQQSVKAFDISEARRLAEEAANALPNVPLEDADNARVHYYFMICKESVKDAYNQMSMGLGLGFAFTEPFASNITSGVADYFGCEGALTEIQRQKLATLESVGSDQIGNEQVLYYVRCDSNRDPVHTNISDFAFPMTDVLSLDYLAESLGVNRL